MWEMGFCTSDTSAFLKNDGFQWMRKVRSHNLFRFSTFYCSFHFKYENRIPKLGNNLQCVLTVFKKS